MWMEKAKRLKGIQAKPREHSGFLSHLKQLSQAGLPQVGFLPDRCRNSQLRTGLGVDSGHSEHYLMAGVLSFGLIFIHTRLI